MKNEQLSKYSSPIASDATNVTPLRKPVACPICTKISARDTYPFCCKRCADIDLGRWFNGTYTSEL